MEMQRTCVLCTMLAALVNCVRIIRISSALLCWKKWTSWTAASMWVRVSECTIRSPIWVGVRRSKTAYWGKTEELNCVTSSLGKLISIFLAHPFLSAKAAWKCTDLLHQKVGGRVKPAECKVLVCRIFQRTVITSL